MRISAYIRRGEGEVCSVISSDNGINISRGMGGIEVLNGETLANFFGNYVDFQGNFNHPLAENINNFELTCVNQVDSTDLGFVPKCFKRIKLNDAEKITDTGLIALLKVCPDITHITLEKAKNITNEGLRQLKISNPELIITLDPVTKTRLKSEEKLERIFERGVQSPSFKETGMPL